MPVRNSINFHQTFKPEVQYVSSVLSVADGVTTYDIKDISNMTGIPSGKKSGKVEPHIMYCKYMGLIDFKKENGKYVLSLTPLGDKVYREDPGFQEELSILLCHAMMCRKENGADLWSYIFLEILPKYKFAIKKELLLKELDIAFQGKVNTKNIAPFFGAYNEMFSVTNILKISDELISFNTCKYNKEFIFLYAFVLWTVWDELYSNQDEITSTQLDELKYRGIFGWSPEQEYKVLEQMSDKGIIRLNRQLVPYTLLKLYSTETLINKLYSELC